MDDYVEQNDISDDVSYDESSDVSIDDSDALETDDIVDDVEVDESIESFDDTTEENVEFEEDSIDFETDESEDNIDDIPEDTITEDEALEEDAEEFSEDVVTENESASEYEHEEILEDTLTEEELSSENEQEDFLEDTVEEENLVADSSSDNSEDSESEDVGEIPVNESINNENESNDGLEETVISETEIEEANSDLEESEISAEVNDEEERNNDNAERDSVDAAIEEENLDESETMDSQNDNEQIEVIDDAINETVNSEIVESDAELENSEEPDEDSDAATDETNKLQDADSVDGGKSNDGFDTDEVSTDENNDTDSDVETVNEQEADAAEITLEESDIPNASDTGNIDVSQDIDSVEVDTDIVDVDDSGNGEQSLRDRVIHPSLGQTVKIAHNMGDTLKADDEGYQTVKGYRVGKAGHLVNSTASKIANTAPGQTLIDKSVIDDAAHSFDSGYAALHPEEKFDFKTPSELSVEERDSHTLEVEMPTPSYEIDESVFETSNGEQEKTMHDNLHDPNLFENNAPGDYTYENSESGKKAYGSLEVSDEGVRDAQAQRSAGGEDRKADDDGGHLIGTRFNGAPDSRNLDAQNANLNRGSYNRLEKSWQESLNNGDKIFLNVETPRDTNADRPDAYMGYTITEHQDGSREWDAFSYANASKREQAEWNQDSAEAFEDNLKDFPNPMEEEYKKNNYTNKS